MASKTRLQRYGNYARIGCVLILTASALTLVIHHVHAAGKILTVTNTHPYTGEYQVAPRRLDRQMCSEDPIISTRVIGPNKSLDEDCPDDYTASGLCIRPKLGTDPFTDNDDWVAIGCHGPQQHYDYKF